MTFVSITCKHCGRVVTRHHAAKFCFDCTLHKRQPLAASASNKVKAAVKKGQLLPATTFDCVDCSEPAIEYDHRDYEKPLDVVPVCRSCNVKRGAALPYSKNKLRLEDYR